MEAKNIKYLYGNPKSWHFQHLAQVADVRRKATVTRDFIQLRVSIAPTIMTPGELFISL